MVAQPQSQPTLQYLSKRRLGEVEMIRIKGIPKKIYSEWSKQELIRFLAFIISYRHQIEVKKVSSKTIFSLKEIVDSQKDEASCRKLLLSLKKELKNFEGIVTAIAEAVQVDENWIQQQKMKSKFIQANQSIDTFQQIWKTPSFEEQCLNILQDSLDLDGIEIKLQDLIIEQQSRYHPEIHSITNVQTIKLKVNYIKENISNFTEGNEAYQNQKQQNQESSINHQICMMKETKKRKTLNYWGDREKIRFITFLIQYKHVFRSRKKILKQGIFSRMSNFIGNKTDDECKAFYYDNSQDRTDIDGLIQAFLKNVYTTEEEIKKEVKRVQQFYQHDRRNELNAFLLRNCEFISGRIEKDQNRSFNNSKSTEAMQLQEKEEEMTEEITQIEIPIELQLMIEKEEVSPEQKKEKSLFSQTNLFEWMLEQAKQIKLKIYQSLKIDGNEIEDQKKQASQRIDKNRDKQMILPPKTNFGKTPTYWTVSQHMKFLLFLLVNKDLLNLRNDRQRSLLWKKLSQFIATNKTPHHCQYHLSDIKRTMKSNDLNIVLQIQGKRVGITSDFIEKRKECCEEKEKYILPLGQCSLKLETSKIYLKVPKTQKLNMEQSIKVAKAHLQEQSIPITVHLLFSKVQTIYEQKKETNAAEMKEQSQIKYFNLEKKELNKSQLIKIRMNYKVPLWIHEKYVPIKNFQLNPIKIKFQQKFLFKREKS